MSNFLVKLRHSTAQFWLLALFLVIVFATGGSSRVDVQSLVILSPVSVIFCVASILTLRYKHIQENRFLFALCVTVIVLVIAHLLPMPPRLWQSVSMEPDLVSIRAFADTWQPLTPVPGSGWQALLALATPLTVILLSIQIGRDDTFRILTLVIALATLSGFIGLIQSVSNPSGALYFYRITNNGSAVGLFANRNHAATLLACLFPMLAAYACAANVPADDRRRRQLYSFATGIVLIPLILITGSRSGFLSALIGLAGAAFLFRKPAQANTTIPRSSDRTINPVPFLMGLLAIALAFLTVFFSRAEAFERFFGKGLGEDGRGDFLNVSMSLVWKYFPWGSGSGSFVEMYQLAQPVSHAGVSYINRAHNDWVETMMAFGLPGAILLLLFLFVFIWQTLQLWRCQHRSQQSAISARTAGIVIAILLLASVTDYPLRTPIMMSVMALFTTWFFKDTGIRGDANV